MEALEKKPSPLVLVEVSGVDYCDVAGISLLLELRRRQGQSGGELEIQGLKPEFQRLLDMFHSQELELTGTEEKKRFTATEEIGWAAHLIWQDLLGMIIFIGELSLGLAGALIRPRQVRWKDALHSAETSGVNALPIVLLISFLVGLIMSFQAAIPMRMFGAEIFVANLIALSMVRELGPLMTAIVLAGRSASAFAAELGTMKVNEEINALTTMGLDPVRFLVVPRVLAAVVITPMLTVFADLVGVVGGLVVLLSLGFTPVSYINQVLTSINHVDFLGGLVKSFVFGILIAGIGCLRGLQTGTGASAVGDSTTQAVVSSIIMIVVTDGLFAVVFFYLGI
ncbi:MAG: MlaE family lipid ABC transporter permease subunit [Pseudomonadota bacterium]